MAYDLNWKLILLIKMGFQALSEFNFRQVILMKTRKSIFRYLRAVWWMYRPDQEDMLSFAAAFGFVATFLLVLGGLK